MDLDRLIYTIYILVYIYIVYTISQPSMLYLVAGAEPHTSGKSDLDTGEKNYSILGCVLFKKRGKKPDSYFFIAPLPPSSNVWLKIAPSLPHTAMGGGAALPPPPQMWNLRQTSGESRIFRMKEKEGKKNQKVRIEVARHKVLDHITL